MCYDETNTLATHNKRKKSTKNTIEVPMATLDTVIPKDTQINLLKLDCEGMELSVLRGAEQLIERCAPVIQFEYKPALMRDDQTHDLEIFDWLVHKGYTIVNKFARQVDHTTIKDKRVQLVPLHSDLAVSTAPTYCDFFAVKHRHCSFKGGRFVWQ